VHTHCSESTVAITGSWMLFRVSVLARDYAYLFQCLLMAAFGVFPNFCSRGRFSQMVTEDVANMSSWWANHVQVSMACIAS